MCGSHHFEMWVKTNIESGTVLLDRALKTILSFYLFICLFLRSGLNSGCCNLGNFPHKEGAIKNKC